MVWEYLIWVYNTAKVNKPEHIIFIAICRDGESIFFAVAALNNGVSLT